MKEMKYYTAIGCMSSRQEKNGEKHLTVIANHKEYVLDYQEAAVWIALAWKLLSIDKLEYAYDQLMYMQHAPKRSLEFCLERMESRGLIAVGSGATVYDAFYDMMSTLYVVPIRVLYPMRIIGFLRMAFNGVSLKTAAAMVRRDNRSHMESTIMNLCKQNLLATAEIITCVESGVQDISIDDKLMDVLFDDESATSDNLIFAMRESPYMIPVVMSISNLLLRKQIFFDRQ